MKIIKLILFLFVVSLFALSKEDAKIVNKIHHEIWVWQKKIDTTIVLQQKQIDSLKVIIKKLKENKKEKKDMEYEY